MRQREGLGNGYHGNKQGIMIRVLVCIYVLVIGLYLCNKENGFEGDFSLSSKVDFGQWSFTVLAKALVERFIVFIWYLFRTKQ